MENVKGVTEGGTPLEDPDMNILGNYTEWLEKNRPWIFRAEVVPIWKNLVGQNMIYFHVPLLSSPFCLGDKRVLVTVMGPSGRCVDLVLFNSSLSELDNNVDDERLIRVMIDRETRERLHVILPEDAEDGLEDMKWMQVVEKQEQMVTVLVWPMQESGQERTDGDKR